MTELAVNSLFGCMQMSVKAEREQLLLLCCRELLCILSLSVSPVRPPARLPVSVIDSCSQASVYAAQVLLVPLSSSGEGRGVIENRNAD